MDLERLPADLISHILSRLPGPDLARACQVNKEWLRVGSSSKLWYGLFVESWGEAGAAQAQEEHQPWRSWKHAFEVQARRDRIGSDVAIVREGQIYLLVCKGHVLKLLGTAEEASESIGADFYSLKDGQRQCTEGMAADGVPEPSNLMDDTPRKAASQEYAISSHRPRVCMQWIPASHSGTSPLLDDHISRADQQIFTKKQRVVSGGLDCNGKPGRGPFDRIITFIGDLEQATRRARLAELLNCI